MNTANLMVSNPRELNKNVIYDETYNKWYTKSAWERAIKEGRVRLPETKGENQFTSSKLYKQIKSKFNYLINVAGKLQSNENIDFLAYTSKAKSLAQELNQLIVSVDPAICNKEDIAELNDFTARIKEIVQQAENIEANFKVIASSQQQVPIQQPAAASSLGFNIGNFIKDNRPNHNGPIMNPDTPKQIQPKGVFPHQISGLTPDQILEEVQKHFSVLQALDANPLYDLMHNKILHKKMKEFDCKYRPENPYFTQIVAEYVSDPELGQKYPLCFTMPCNDKNYMIAVLFNTIPYVDPNTGTMKYPIHVLKKKIA